MTRKELRLNLRGTGASIALILIIYWVNTGSRVLKGERNFVLARPKIQAEDKRLFREQENGFGVGNRLARIRLAKAFLDLCQETEPFDRILKRGRIRKPLHNLKDFLFHRFRGHRDHLIRLVL